jgi:hypothetical protein
MSETKSFWTTLPGILTGIAGIITAIGGLLVVLYQIEVIGPNRISGEIESERQSSEKPVRSEPEPMPEPEPEPEQQTKPYSSVSPQQQSLPIEPPPLIALLKERPLTEGSYITARNRSEYIGNNRWNWTIFIDAPPEVLSKIDCVQSSRGTFVPSVLDGLVDL